jgi:hypothetical protein
MVLRVLRVLRKGIEVPHVMSCVRPFTLSVRVRVTLTLMNAILECSACHQSD